MNTIIDKGIVTPPLKLEHYKTKINRLENNSWT